MLVIPIHRPSPVVILFSFAVHIEMQNVSQPIIQVPLADQQMENWHEDGDLSSIGRDAGKGAI
jgi:hypothetical protein